MQDLHIVTNAEADAPVNTTIQTENYAADLLWHAETHGVAVTHHGGRVGATGLFVKNGERVGDWTMMQIPAPTSAEAVKSLANLSQAFAKAWAERNEIDGRSSHDARDTVKIVCEGTSPVRALRLVGFPID